MRIRLLRPLLAAVLFVAWSFDIAAARAQSDEENDAPVVSESAPRSPFAPKPPAEDLSPGHGGGGGDDDDGQRPSLRPDDAAETSIIRTRPLASGLARLPSTLPGELGSVPSGPPLFSKPVGLALQPDPWERTIK